MDASITFYANPELVSIRVGISSEVPDVGAGLIDEASIRERNDEDGEIDIKVALAGVSIAETAKPVPIGVRTTCESDVALCS